MKIEDLKQGDKFYDVTYKSCYSYEYLMPLPNNDKYHILIDQNKEPVRIYEENLQNILNLGIFTYVDARKKRIELLETLLKRLKNENNKD